MKLTLEHIRTYNMEERVIIPDYDDAKLEFTLPCGVAVSGFYVCNNEPCEMKKLEGLDGWILVEDEKSLRQLHSLSSWEELLEWVKVQEGNEEFDPSEYE